MLRKIQFLSNVYHISITFHNIIYDLQKLQKLHVIIFVTNLRLGDP